VVEELWIKIRGIDRWPETVAEVTGVFRFRGRRSDLAVVTFRYKDEAARDQTGQFRVDSYSSIYNLSIGDVISIRYNPAHPDKYVSVCSSPLVHSRA
jgi:hypothetical protein